MKVMSSAMGNGVMLMFSCITAISSMAIHQTTQTISPFLSAFYTFLFCLIGYSIFGTLGLLKKIQLLKSNLPTLCILNITTAICWIFSFVALKYLPPTLYLFIYLCAMPIASSLIYRVELQRALILMVGIVVLATTYPVMHLQVGFMLAFLGGVSGTIYSIYSKRITTYYKSLEILSIRFYLTVIITLIICIHFHEFKFLDYHYYVQFTVLSLISIFIPLLLFQIGINHLPIQQAMNYLPLAPLLCYALNILICNEPISLIQFVTVITLFTTMFIKLNKKRKVI